MSAMEDFSARSCYLNGDIVLYKDCHLHISDLLIQRGYGVFDFFRCRNGNILWFDDYRERLFNSMRMAGIDAPITPREFTSVVKELQQRNHCENDAFKVIVTGGYSDTLESVTGEANMIILNVPWRKPPAHTFEKGVNLISWRYVRPNPEIKSLNYFNLLMLRKKMKEHDAVDVLYHTDTISEASRANLFFVKGDTIFTPASGMLEGVTRKQILRLHKEIRVENIPFERLYGFDEMFLASTSRDITPVVAVDGRAIGNGRPGRVTGGLMI